MLAAPATTLALAFVGDALAQSRDKPSRHFEDALRRFENNDLAGAAIQLRSALQQDPMMLAAHVLLGRTELARGDAPAAESAFALQLGVDQAEIAVPMAQALLDQRKFESLLERFTPEGLPPATKAALLVLRGHAYEGLGELRSAACAFEDALAIDAKFVPALLSHGELLAQQGKRKEALSSPTGNPAAVLLSGKSVSVLG